MNNRTCLSIILAAGEGTRMKSALPKVLHPLAGLPLIAHALKAARANTSAEIALVIGRDANAVREAVSPFAPDVDFFEQTERLGTAHAVLVARQKIECGYDDILVMFADTPLVETETLDALRAQIAAGAAVAVMGFHAPDPTGYGRLIERDDALVAIREERDANEEERRIDFCNGGIMAIAGNHALALLEAIGNDNDKREFYLTDIVGIAMAKGLKVATTTAPYESVLGVNTRVELAQAEEVWQQRRRRALMLSGVTMIAPHTVHLHHDTEVEQDVTIEPNVFFGPGVRVATGARIRAFSHIEGAVVGPNAEIGPFARLRPGTQVGEKAKIGNFCEVKNATLDTGAKVNHLTYIGDAHIGAKANIGAGTITCNYDGFSKHKTQIGAGAFIGSNSSLIAPVTVADGAYVASGSVITKDVPADALAFGRSRQENRNGLAKTLRQKLASAKQAKKPQ